MIELYELRQFAAFVEAGTLSDAAEALHLSQPALSRNMKKLEDDLGITLFERKKNKLELNDNGQYVFELAKKILEEADALIVRARDYDRKNRTIAIGVCAPAPVWRLTPLLSNLYPHMSIQTEIEAEYNLMEGLKNNVYQLIVTLNVPNGDQFYTVECGKESLMFALPKGHKYARRKSLSFKEMDGENMLLMSGIGFWDFVQTEKMPHSRFLTQNDRFSFNELVQASSLPSFTSDLAERYTDVAAGRINIPISDPEATVTYHLVCLANRKKEFYPMFKALSDGRYYTRSMKRTGSL